jgi:peptide-methionine (S)-S-oxide reductase
MSTSSNTESITLGGGCFWCTEAVFDRVQGVVDVESGYCNGQTLNPTYEQVCSGRTGHVEVVKVAFDPALISLREVLEIFFVVHDPTTLNRQGNDVGTQYRSGIYTTSDAQKEVAQGVIREITESKTYRSPIVT